ncbi:hypothetical protein NFC81_01685 [Salinispirillum sp. LH 10-3-1]|uniref:Uncharacterized protein n=1 Tax=Salinispirillum sp. LH 10-3-1 TaxID=2952525 RepID=A0AB38YGR4_9GAMM
MSERSIGIRSGLLTQAHADRMRTPSMACALRASLRLSKFVPDKFVEQQVNNALARVNNLTHKMSGTFCSATAPVGLMPGMASGESILAKAFRGELTEQYKPHPCSLPFGPAFGRSKSLPAILWRKDSPELISGENSAEALLERIKAERAATKPTKRTLKSKADA